MRKLLFCAVLLLTASEASANEIVNGDFEAGNAGFRTDYFRSPGDIGPAGSFDIVTNPAHSRPHDIHPVSYGDETTGAGLMMAVNATVDGNHSVWSQMVPVTPLTDYNFAVGVSSWFGAPLITLDVQFNGVSLMSLTQGLPPAMWENHEATWNSGSNTSVMIDIRNMDGADVGGDFALDDISLTAVQIASAPEPSSLLLTLTGVSLLGCGYLRRK